ncbi:protein FAM162A-like [Mya arenaria]|uniref:protein FAM162A-like n=1 Tax=Mya arenaria TaxID=6604 RepID=UPI0022E56265|nr:protein FAM162A-like [Mya arenaria]
MSVANFTHSTICKYGQFYRLYNKLPGVLTRWRSSQRNYSQDSKSKETEKAIDGPMDKPETELDEAAEQAIYSAKRDSGRSPSNLDKICLLWAGKFKHRDEIPEFVRLTTIIYAKDYTRVVIMIWLVCTFLVSFFVLSRFGARKVRIIHEDVTQRQQAIWDKKNKIADEEYAKKKEKERLEKEAHLLTRQTGEKTSS